MRPQQWGRNAFHAMCIVTIIATTSTLVNPLEPAVAKVQDFVRSVGAFAVCAVGVITVLRQRSTALPFADLLSLFIRRITLYCLILWLIGRGGDEVYRWVLANPNDVPFFVISLFLIWLIGRPRPTSQKTGDLDTGAMATPLARPTGPSLSERDKQYTAVHEAGHVLTYAALAELPSSLTLVVNGHISDKGVLGFTQSLSTHLLQSHNYAEWLMHLYLAGPVAERYAYRDAVVGGLSDNDHWLTTARDYLVQGTHWLFYVNPVNQFEHQSNEAKLEALRQHQCETLNELFSLNHDLLKTLAAELIEKGKMDAHEIRPYLDRVTLPDGFPRPNGDGFVR